jgi:micrococcal nuclease
MYEYTAKVVRVVDGDTVDALIDCGFSISTHQRIRLLGINTAECRTRDKEEKKKGLAAKARLKELIRLGKGQFFVKTFLDKKGKYGRLLGALYNLEVDRRTYNDILLEEGHATAYLVGSRK